MKSAFPKAQILGEDTKMFFEKMFRFGWTQIHVYNNPIVKDGIETGETTLDITLAGFVEHMPKHYEFGEEIVTGIHKVINKTYQVKEKKARPVAEPEQHVE